jgi:Tfp pilus assembly pilus retraction ATPase PilT
VLPQPTIPPAFAQAVAKLIGEDKVQQIMGMLQEGQNG